ncbi:hypothetical protein [Winogradskyella vincentii]|uniref:BlaR1 peptidase M56 n=1 Tax=Winogradskyella vincentii TaxID=2877122 RepID=A0ABS7Y342_9FLAO|nr:hypothetical protein [Winogradskyella vincentii]MCA0154344.1 hypothetical protein [Winogradskyella vincentii]
MILISKYIVPRGYLGITLFPFMLLKNKALSKNSVLINHEKIHLKQQLELLVIPFFILYGLEFVIRLIKHRNWHLAYKNISFEREAYINESNFDYIRNRKNWSFMNYF